MPDYNGGDFIPMQGGYRKLKAFQLAICISEPSKKRNQSPKTQKIQ